VNEGKQRKDWKRRERENESNRRGGRAGGLRKNSSTMEE
jgi:hypothetical protein